MSACPRPDVVVTQAAPATPGTYTSTAPTPRDESCNATTTVVAKQGSGSTTVNNTTAAGNDCPPLPCILGFKWEGIWSAGKTYKKQVCFTNPNGSVVEHKGSSWLCIQDHTSSTSNEPTAEHATPPAINGSAFWEPLSLGVVGEAAVQAQADAEKSWWDKVTDWVKDADIWDWLKVAAIAGGLLYYGLGLLSGDGTKDGKADKRYNGTDGYNGTYTTPLLKSVLQKLCEYGGITTDVTLISDTETVEFTIASTTSVRTILQELSAAFNFDMVNSGGVLKFVPRSGSAVATITLADMGFSANATPPAPYVSRRFQGVALPRKINVTYFSPSMDFNSFTQTAELFTYAEGNELTLNVPITLTDQQARKIAELNLINAHLERMNYKFTTSYKFIANEPGDVLNSPMGLIRITKINETDAGLLAFEACDAGEPSAASLSNLAYVTPPEGTNNDYTLGYSQAFFIDPPWTGTEDTGVRLYATIHGYEKQGWPGAMVYISRDNGNNYSTLLTVNQETTWGVAQSILVAPVIETTGADTGWDITNTVSVTLKTGQLTSASVVEVDNGTNWIYIGQELIGFQTATLTATKTYTLSKLKRGLQGTKQFGSSHVANEISTLFSSMVKIPLLDSDYGKTLHFKTVTIGSGLDVADEDVVTVMSNNNKLFAPTNGNAVKQVDNSWLISWTENIRTPDVQNNGASTLTQTDVDQSGYGVAILDSLGNVVSTRPCGTTNFTYTTVEQLADFGALQNNLHVSIVPMHKKFGGGYPLSINT